MRDIVFSVGAEGGSLAVYRINGGTTDVFEIELNEVALYDLCDDLEGEPITRSSQFDSFEKALARLDRGWPNLTPLYVHRDVREVVWAAVSQELTDESWRLARWRHQCVEPESHHRESFRMGPTVVVPVGPVPGEDAGALDARGFPRVNTRAAWEKWLAARGWTGSKLPKEFVVRDAASDRTWLVELDNE